MLKQKFNYLKFLLFLVSRNMFISNITAFIGLVVVISLYLLQINTTTQLSLQTESIEAKVAVAQEVSHDLQLEVAKYQSITSLQDRIKDMDLASVTQVSYVSVAVPVSAVAKR